MMRKMSVVECVGGIYIILGRQECVTNVLMVEDMIVLVGWCSSICCDSVCNQGKTPRDKCQKAPRPPPRPTPNDTSNNSISLSLHSEDVTLLGDW